MSKVLVLFAIILKIGTYCINAECPPINDIPVMNEDGTNFVCAQSWNAPGSENAIEGCNMYPDPASEPFTHWKGDDDDETNCCFWPMGSIIVKAGCILYAWEHEGYTGDLFEYLGPNVYPNGCTNPNDDDTCPPAVGDPNFASGPVSFKCRCDQDPIICVPEDSWDLIMQCDNAAGSTAAICKYKKTIGTKYTEEVTNSMSIDASIEYAMTASYFTLFSETIGISVSTGYDWTHVSSETQSEEQSYEVDIEVPAGYIVMIYNAIGQCDGSTSKTELFRFDSYDPEGTLVEEKFEGL